MHALTLPGSWWIFWIGGNVPKAPPPAPPPDTGAADAAMAEEKRKARLAKGGRANILTSPTGADLGGIGGADTAPAPKAKLGG